MTLRERIPTWLGGKAPAPVVSDAELQARAATDPIAFHDTHSFGPGIGGQPDHERLLNGNVGVVDMGTRAIANRVSTLDPLVKTSRNDGTETLVDETLDDHPLKALLDKPHPDFSRSMLLRLTAQWIVTVGEAYWLKVGSRLQRPIELHPIPPTRIAPELSGGVVSGYNVTTASGQPKHLDRDMVIRFYFPDPANMHGSEGYIGPNGTVIDSYAFSGQHLRAHYEDDATPKVVLKALEGAVDFTDPQKDRFYSMWRKAYHQRRGTRKGLPAILPTFYDMVTIAAQGGADIVPLLNHWRDDQLMGLGVSRAILGQVTSGDRSSAEVQQWAFDRYTILPIATLISDGITLQLAPDFDVSLFVEFDGFVSEDKRFLLEQETADLVNKVRSPQQILRDRNSDPEDAPWGKDPVGKTGEIPYTGEGFTFEDDDPGALGGEPAETEEEEEERKRLPLTDLERAAFFMPRASFFHPDAEWLRQVAREKAYVPSFLRAMRTIFRDQLASVLKRLEELVPRSRVTAAELFTPAEWAGLFERRVEPVRLKAFEAILTESLSGLGVDEFVFTDEMRFMLRQQGALLVKHTGATTQNMIARQLELGTAEGEGVDQIAKRIKGVFAERRQSHARTIARSEVLKASQEAQLSSFEIAGVEKKQWNDSMDGAVRHSHANVQEPIVPIGEPFVLGDGELADAPGIGAGGGQLSAGNAINCRCFLTPVLPEG